MNKRDKYDLQPEGRVSLSEKFASYYGNLRGLLLGSNLTGRRATNFQQENPFCEEAQLTAYKKDKDKDGKEDGQLKPKSVDFLRGKNRQAHRTSDYEIPNLIIRRGQQFDVSITFDRSFSCQDDGLVLKFVTVLLKKKPKLLKAFEEDIEWASGLSWDASTSKQQSGENYSENEDDIVKDLDFVIPDSNAVSVRPQFEKPDTSDIQDDISDQEPVPLERNERGTHQGSEDENDDFVIPDSKTSDAVSSICPQFEKSDIQEGISEISDIQEDISEISDIQEDISKLKPVQSNEYEEGTHQGSEDEYDDFVIPDSKTSDAVSSICPQFEKSDIQEGISEKPDIADIQDDISDQEPVPLERNERGTHQGSEDENDDFVIPDSKTSDAVSSICPQFEKSDISDIQEDISEISDIQEDISEISDIQEDISEISDIQEDISEISDIQEDISKLKPVQSDEYEEGTHQGSEDEYDDDVKDPDFVISDSESSDAVSSIYPQFEKPDYDLLDIEEDISNLKPVSLAVEEEFVSSSDNEDQESPLNPERFLKSVDMILDEKDKEEVIQDCCVSSSDWCAHSRDLQEGDKVFCEKYSSVYINKFKKDNSKSKTGRSYDVVHSCYFCGRLMTDVQTHLINAHKEKEPVQEILKLQKEAKTVSNEDGKRGLRDQIRMKQTLLRNEGDNKHNYHVMMNNEGELLLRRRRMGKFNSEDYGPCPECKEWMVLKDNYLKHRPSCPKNSQCSTSIAIVQSYVYKGKVSENASNKMKSEVFPSMTKDELTRIAINDTLIVAVGEWHFIKNMGNKIKRRNYSSFRMRLCARLLKLVREELQDSNATMRQCLVRENFDLFAKAALLACGTNTDDELKHPTVALKMGYDLARLVAAEMTFCSKKRDEVGRKEAKRFCGLLNTDWKLKFRHQARILLEERSFNKRVELPDPQDVADLAEYLVKSLQNQDLTTTDPSTFRRAVVLTEARLLLYNRRRPGELEALSLASYKRRSLGVNESDLSLRKELSEMEKHLLESQELVEIRGKTGRRVPVLLPAEVHRHLQYLTDTTIRSAVGISDGNTYVFASSGHDPVRAGNALDVVKYEPDLKYPNRILATNLRKHTATISQVMGLKDHELKWLTNHLGHTQKVHMTHYRATSGLIERLDIAKIMLLQEKNNVGKFAGVKLSDIQFQDLDEGTDDTPGTREVENMVVEELDEELSVLEDEKDETDKGRSGKKKTKSDYLRIWRQPLQSKSTVVPVHRVEALRDVIWGYQLVRVEDKVVHLKVCTAADAIVGRYNLFIETTHKNEQGEIEKYRYAQPDDIYLLFNPWCKEDQVYVDEETHREEYVLSETGRIWLGTVGKFCVRPWNFGQFDDVCLVAAIAIMEKSELGDQARGNAVFVIRALSRVINNNERDGGVLVGNWSGKYDDGVAPHAWNGSTAILEEFLKKRKGVKYGQCWTFAAVATTVFRALGIPTRCVTSFKAAHDSDYSSPMDSHWSVDGKPKTSMNDAIWDFHVWNESWCKRPDLPSGYDGWQAYDPTPQECLEGVFTCGPASVKAVRQGEIFYGYDTQFIFAEVNGDRVHWTVDQEGNMTAVGVDKDMMGKYISTKAVSTISREDLTNTYKYSEDDDEKAVTGELARKLSSRVLPEIEPAKSCDVQFDLITDMQRSGDFSAALKIKNTSAEARMVDVHLTALSCRYTGIPTTELKESSSATVLEPNTETEVDLSLKCVDYISSVDSDSHLNLYAIAHVKETGQRYILQEPVWIEKPHIELKTEGSAHVGKPFDVVIKLVNPLSVPLTNGHLNIEGPGMQRLASIKVKKPLAQGEELRETVQMRPRRLGRKEIIANFQCKQMSDVTGVIEIDVIDDTRA